MQKILITGIAGFIGYHTARKLLGLGYEIIGIDNLNTYYDVQLKLDRLNELGIDVHSDTFIRQTKTASSQFDKLSFLQLDLTNKDGLFHLVEEEKPYQILHLAAQAGVRYSILNPDAYVQSNVVGFANILEACRRNDVKHLVYASSSSVYGNTSEVPFSESDRVDEPVSLYAATKKSNELMAHTYNHLYGFPCTGLRFFTVYGPWGRPDMAAFLFTRAIIKGEPIKVFNYGELWRDFTFIDDIVEGVIGVIRKEPFAKVAQIFNIGNNQPVKLLDFIQPWKQPWVRKRN
ncbi:NAD-dependent epimerase/dehydratase family protein [Croceimicrobium sp.]|uniref:NAD-dependent epimerase/dehydratase family protein n=1 Tax=Croceimicrobium sp. TaxID=2828340 RepID=UPI003BAA5920